MKIVQLTSIFILICRIYFGFGVNFGGKKAIWIAQRKMIECVSCNGVEGDRVIETGKSCMLGCTGTVYKNSRGFECVLWDGPEKMGTSVTWGTRRISDFTPEELLEFWR